MDTYLLTWNPKNFAWEDLKDNIAELRSKGSVHSWWSCGNVRHIPEGSRFFLIRLGREPKGLVGSGSITRSTYEGPHWDQDKADAGESARFVDIRFDYLNDVPLVRRPELDHPPFAEFKWDSQMSGVRIPPEIAAPLEEFWSKRTERPATEEISLRDTSVEHWKDLLARFRENDERVERERLRDARRREVLPDINQVLQQVLSEELPLEEFRDLYQHRTMNEWDLFGLKGMSGAMFLNKLAKYLADQEDEVLAQLAATLAAPSDSKEARAKLTDFRAFLDEQIEQGVARKKQIAPAFATFFVTSWWHMQDPELWPIFYVSARRALHAEGLVGKRLRGADGYLEFRRVYQALQEALGISSWDLEHLLAWVYSQQTSVGQGGDDGAGEDIGEEDPPAERVWLIAPGPRANRWEEFYKEKKAAIGWDELGDLTEYEDLESIKDALRAEFGRENPSMDALCCYQFANTMEVGDTVFAKRGRKEIVGYGVVSSEYRYDPDRKDFRHIRGVDWKKRGRWVPREKPMVTKTLTEIGRYPGLVADIRNAIGIADDEPIDDDGPRSNPAYDLSQAVEELFVPEPKIIEALELLKYKKNIILQGPPGVGKTFFAKRLAHLLLEEKDPERVAQVQFHQSYAYEDFVQGYRPGDDGKFGRADGPFLRFCDQALQDRESPYVFIIDEINRGNLSKIFGELLLLIEADKRSEAWSTSLTYSKEGEERFYIPPNLHIIGTMNTADRSLAMVDYALRRRFAFVDLNPAFASKRFANRLSQLGAEPELRAQITERFARLNRDIASTPDLGDGFCIGHSYFCRAAPDQEADQDWYDRIIRTEVQPLLKEYWFDDTEKADEQVAFLLDDD